MLHAFHWSETHANVSRCQLKNALKHMDDFLSAGTYAAGEASSFKYLNNTLLKHTKSSCVCVALPGERRAGDGVTRYRALYGKTAQ